MFKKKLMNADEERIIYLLELKRKYENNLKYGIGHASSIQSIITKIREKLDALLQSSSP